MTKWFIFFLLICFPFFSFGQQYRAGQKTVSPSFDKWEISAAWVVSSQEAGVKNGSTSLDGLHGFSARALFYPLSYLGVGVEGTQFTDEKITPLVTSYKARQLGVVGKLSLSPNTNPRVYITVGAGKAFYKLRYASMVRRSEDKKDITYLTGGLGVEVDVYKSIFFALEGRLFYHTQTELTDFYALSKKMSFDGRFGLGIRF